MLVENEIKLRVPERQCLGRVLDACRTNYVLVSNWRVEHDTYFDTAEGFLREDDLTLRIRELPSSASVAVKGPRKRRASGEYYRFEVEIQVPNVDELKRRLLKEGFLSKVTIEKRRVEFRKADDTRVCVDELPHIGHFMEIEGPSESIQATLAELSAETLERVGENYTELLERHLRSQGEDMSDGLTAIFVGEPTPHVPVNRP